ncbi:hypothetical protein FRC17_001194 [Serendipita sp. 399]|nr:hypothetical protein FRC17_001194 [Serendipita sp. 399]
MFSASIVAIHGLDGHREKSWTTEDKTMWLKDVLPNDLPNARILTYGYDADTRSFSQTSTQTIFRHAEAFAEDLSRQRRTHPERPIIFLAHSLGGIILKRALAHCHIYGPESGHYLRDIITSTLGVLLFGTPHAGANGVELAEWMHRLLSVYMSTTNEILKHLNRDSSALEEIQAQYLPASQRIDTIFFYEEYPTPLFGGLNKMIVPRHLAIIAGESRAKTVVLHADHCEMVKFNDKHDINYRKVVDYLHELVENGPAKVRENWIRENSYRIPVKGELLPPQQIVLPKPLLPVSRNYVQRPELEAFLTKKLVPAFSAEQQARCVLHGLGGGGKTQVASSWIEGNRDKFNRVIVIDASSQQQIEADLERAIRSIGPQYDKSTWKDTLAYLSSQKGWLLFFDNADSPGLHLDNYLPSSTNGAILITTWNRDCINYAPDSHITVGTLTENEAINLLHKVADVVPPSNEASLAIALARLFSTLYHRGRLEETEQIGRDALALQTEILGERHPETITTMGNLALALHQLGQFEEAERMGRKVVALQAEIHGARHLETARAMGNLALTLQKCGKLEEAEKNGREVLALRVTLLGPRHPHTILAMGQLATTLCMRGQLEEAETMEREVLTLSTEIHGPRHPDTVMAMGNLAWTVHTIRGPSEEAEAMTRDALALSVELLGLRHPDTTRTMINLAKILFALNKLEEAVEMQIKVLALLTDTLGPEHPFTIDTMDELAFMVSELDRRRGI